MTFFGSLFLVHTLAYAAPLLDPAAAYPLRVESQGAGPAVKTPESFYSEMEMDFQSFDPSDASGQPLMGNRTTQLVKMKKLPNDPSPESKKNGVGERLELTYERLSMASQITVPGMKKTFQTKSDLGAILKNKPLVVCGDGKVARKVEGLERVRSEAMSEVKDPVARTALATMLKEDLLLKTGTAVHQNSSCLAGLGGKKPGEKWKFSLEEGGTTLDYDCRFEGWSEAKGKMVAVVKITANQQRQSRRQPNGAPAVAITEGSGTVFYAPTTEESLLRMETSIRVEPGEEEMKRLQARGAAIPRNRSVMKIWNHLYPLTPEPGPTK